MECGRREGSGEGDMGAVLRVVAIVAQEEVLLDRYINHPRADRLGNQICKSSC